MRTSPNKLFLNASIVLLYCICISEFTYIPDYHNDFKEFKEKCDSEHERIQNIYRANIGDNSRAEAVAEAYFDKHTFSKIFKKCPDAYFTIIRFFEGRTSVHKSKGFYSFRYKTEKQQHSKQSTLVRLELQGKSIYDNTWYIVGEFKLTLDYNLNVTEVQGFGDASKGLPVFGKGKTPHSFSCEYLNTHESNYVN